MLPKHCLLHACSIATPCALKPQCTRNQANRTITREDNELLMEQMARRLKAQIQKFALRKTLAEHPLGTIKRWFGYTNFG